MDISSAYIPINVGVKFISTYGNVQPYVVFAPGLYLPVGANSETHTPAVHIVDDLTFNVGAGFNTAAGFRYGLRRDLLLNVELNANYAFATVNEETVTTTTIATGAAHTDIVPHQNDQAGYPAQTQYSFSSVGFKVGVVKMF